MGALALLFIFMAIAFVPASCLSDNATLDEWMHAHTLKVNATTTYHYEQGALVITETYRAEELKERFEIEQLTKELTIPVDEKSLVGGKVLGLQEGEEKVTVTEIITVLISGDDPPPWWDTYSYPQWAWSKSGDLYEKEDPINLAWKNTPLNAVKAEILEEEWVDWGTWYNFYVYDPLYGWIADDNVADDPVGLFGRYHARLWEMSDGNVVANAHHDSAVPHEADELEEAEELVVGFFNESEDTEWTVYEDSYDLGNTVTSPYSDGWCTQISSATVFDTEESANPFPSICGHHTGTITLNQTMAVSKLYTYPCSGTGGYTTYAVISYSNGTIIAEAYWNGYVGDWHTITFNQPFILREDETYTYTIRTGSYPQIIHEPSFNATGGKITCTNFTDANGVIHYDWIPAIKFF